MDTGKNGKPLVAISSCLLGERVRYDGTGKYDPCVCEQLSDCFDWLPVCPEVAIGLGIPRPPVQLVGLGNGFRAIGVGDASLDITDALVSFANEKAGSLETVSGYIFKSRSPSCGLVDVKWFDSQGRQQGVTAGLYAEVLRHSLPELPVIDETRLKNTEMRDDFVYKVVARWSRQSAGKAE